jgi:hypothetical protein
MLAIWGSSASWFPFHSSRIKQADQNAYQIYSYNHGMSIFLGKHDLVFEIRIGYSVLFCSNTKNLQRVPARDCRCITSNLNLESLKLKILSTAKTRWQLLFDKLATNMINCPISNPVVSFIWPWDHHFWSFCWVMFLLPRELSITNMLGQVYMEMVQVCMSRPFSVFCEIL